MKKQSNKTALAGICIFILIIISAQYTHGQGNELPQQALTLDPGIGLTTVPLWEGNVPESLGTTEKDVPTLTVFLPQKGQGNGTAVVVALGGGYMGLASNLEGRQVADWFAARGITAFLLKYRLGSKYLYPIPLMDAQRAIRWVRSHHSLYSIEPNKVGMIGFSAGGHLTAMTATSSDFQGKPEATDSIDRLSSKPDFIVLGYPWINAMQPSSKPFIPPYQKLMRISDDHAKVYEEKYTPTSLVTSLTPPTFIFSTTDDAVVSINASLDFYKALISAGVPAEMHIFKHGAHGAGLGPATNPSLQIWPALMGQWLRDQGF